MTNELTLLLADYRAAGWLAFHYPRKRKVSLNGFRPVPEREAIEKMRDALSTHKP